VDGGGVEEVLDGIAWGGDLVGDGLMRHVYSRDLDEEGTNGRGAVQLPLPRTRAAR
jgi:hypothetical protein